MTLTVSHMVVEGFWPVLLYNIALVHIQDCPRKTQKIVLAVTKDLDVVKYSINYPGQSTVRYCADSQWVIKKHLL